MYRILLATTALVSLAGAASAEITWSGQVELGYNDEEQVDDGEGVIATAEITPNLSVELDYGLTVEAEATLIFLDYEGDDGNFDTDDLSDDFEAESFVLTLSDENFGLSIGTVDFAPDTYWKSAGDMESDDFSEADGETGILFTGAYGPLSFGVSGVVHTDDFAVGGNGTGEFDQLGVAVNGTFETFDFSAAYQEEAAFAFDPNENDDFEDAEVFALSVGTTFQNVDVRLGYARNETADTDSTGIELGYGYQDFDFGAYFVSESVGGDNWGLSAAYESGPIAAEAYYEDEQGSYLAGIEGSYELREGVVLLAGVIDDEDANDDGGAYIGAEFDLGNDATFQISYVEADAEDEDEFGAPEFRNGATALLTIEF